MRFRFTSYLLVGLSVAVVGGCHCGEHCRMPFLKRFGGGSAENVTVASNSLLVNDSAGCGCESQATEPWYSDINENDVDESVAPAAPEVQAETEEASEKSQDVPQPPSRKLENGEDVEKLPELKSAVPPDGDTGYFNPSNVLQTNETALSSVEEAVQRLQLEDTANGLSSRKGHWDSPINEMAPTNTAQPNPVATESNATPKTGADQSVLNNPEPPTTPFIPISTSRKIQQPRVIDQNQDNPVEKPANYQLQTLPAKSDAPKVEAPIVLRAIPNGNHKINDRRVADSRGLLTGNDSVSFQDLPSLDQNEADNPVDFSNSDTPFEEPPANSRLPGVEPVPQNRPNPTTEQAPEGFTTSTSYQVPMENDARVLSEVASAIDCGLVDQDSALRLNARPGTHSASALLRSEHSSLRVVAPAQSSLKILRMRAYTFDDRQAKVPPIVSIKSMLEPVIVRGAHPDVNLPLAGKNSLPSIQARPTFDQDRLEASIRGISSRPAVEDAKSNTIDR